MAAVQWHWGPNHPVGMALHDRMCSVYIRARKYEKALEFHNLSLDLAMVALGKNHIVTAGYLTKAGILQVQLQMTDAAIKSLNEALHIYATLSAAPTLLAEVHAYLAEAYDARGDPDAAVGHAQKARRLREKAVGQMDPRSVASCLQVATLLNKPYAGYSGVLTPAIRAAYRETISCYEKAFRYIKTHTVAHRPQQLWGVQVRVSQAGSSGAGSVQALSSAASSVGGGGGASAVLARSSSSCGGASGLQLRRVGSTLSLPVGEGWPSFAPARAQPVAGPAIAPPFAPMPPLPRNMLHRLTRQIVALKLQLLDAPRHRELLRTLRRAALARAGGSGADDGDDDDEGGGSGAGMPLPLPPAPPRDKALYREVIVKMAAVSPSIYLDGLMARIDDEDESALHELAVAIEL
ncbi:hypothetical protein HK405_000877, partial [Cladochytrium tenue]